MGSFQVRLLFGTPKDNVNKSTTEELVDIRHISQSPLPQITPIHMYAFRAYLSHFALFFKHFSYKIAPNELANRTLEITVWDEDFGIKSNEFIGKFENVSLHCIRETGNVPAETSNRMGLTDLQTRYKKI